MNDDPTLHATGNQRIASLLALRERYALFVFDQFGVLHDGQHAYAGMADTLRELKHAGRQIIVVSNSGKRAAYNAQRLADFGFGAELIDAVVSSGEVAWHWLQAEGRAYLLGEAAADARRLPRVFVIARGSPDDAIAGLPVESVAAIEDADGVLIAGSEGEHHSLSHYMRVLQPAADRGLPAICTNPDRIMLVGRDNPHFGAGEIAARYAQTGASVHWIGKPYPAIYRYALNLARCEPRQTVCIGDSVAHDIAGAAGAGCDSVLTATGIHAGESASGLSYLFSKYDVTPTWRL